MRIYFNENDLIKSENYDEVIKDFEFNMDVEFDKSGDDWKIKGLASTEHVDQQGEVVKMSGLDITPLQTGKGIFNYDHQKGPENILGVIENAEIKKDGLHVEGYLLKNCDRAKHIYNILESLKPKDKKRLGLSVEGKVLKRSLDGKTIAAARIDKVALTLDPVNPYTYAEFAKSLEAIETDLNKPIVNTVGYVKVDIGENDLKLPDYEVISNPNTSATLVQITKLEDNNNDYSFTKDELKEIIEYTVNNTIEKTLEIYNDIQKGLSAGDYNVAPSQRTQGAALAKESLCGKKKKKLKDKIKSLVEQELEKLTKDKKA